MPYSLKYNKSAIEDKCTHLANYLNLPKPGFTGLYDFVLALLNEMDLPLSLKELGVNETQADEVAKKAFADPSTLTNPRLLTIESIREVYIQAVHGSL